jgi:linoleoyl-CoA desaturase
MERLPRHPHHAHDRRLLRELQELVVRRVSELPASRLAIVKVNLVLMPAVYLALYLLALKVSAIPWAFLLCYALMGLMTVVIFCELIHELCHNNVFANPRWNALAFCLFDLLGANSFIWRHRHLKSHHRYPNVDGWDTDVEQRGPIAIFPGDDAGGLKRFQHLYVLFLYPFFMLNWLGWSFATSRTSSTRAASSGSPSTFRAASM